MSDILRKQNRTMNCPAVTAGQIPYRNVTVKDKLDELDNRASANTFGTAVDITSYNSSSNTYTFPSDGYVALTASASTSTRIVFQISEGPAISAVYASGNAFNSIFVKKGMKGYVYSNNGNGVASFKPLEGSALPSAESEGF